MVNELLTVQLGGAVRRHCHSTGDVLSASADAAAPCLHMSTVRLRPNRPKSEGSFCGDKMRVKRASSFGVCQLCELWHVSEDRDESLSVTEDGYHL